MHSDELWVVVSKGHREAPLQGCMLRQRILNTAAFVMHTSKNRTVNSAVDSHVAW